jgi:ribosome recycling factor
MCNIEANLKKQVEELTLALEAAQADLEAARNNTSDLAKLADGAAEDVKVATEQLRQAHADEIESIKSEQAANQQKIETLQAEITALQTRHAEEVEKYLAEIKDVRFVCC